jgi:hypothetical protein
MAGDAVAGSGLCQEIFVGCGFRADRWALTRIRLGVGDVGAVGSPVDGRGGILRGAGEDFTARSGYVTVPELSEEDRE